MTDDTISSSKNWKTLLVKLKFNLKKNLRFQSFDCDEFNFPFYSVNKSKISSFRVSLILVKKEINFVTFRTNENSALVKEFHYCGI